MRHKFNVLLSALLLFGLLIVPVGTAGALTNLMLDPSFESSLGSSTFWAQNSSNSDTPLCILSTPECNFGSATAPHTGSIWALFGGIDFSDPEAITPEIGDLYQNVAFPSCGASLQFYFWIGAAPAGSDATDLFYAMIDGLVVFSANATQKSSYPSYTLVTVDVSSFANGAVHKVEFYSSTAGQTVIFNLDDVSLIHTCFAISGNAGIAGATLNYTGGSTTADGSGNYSFEVPSGWSGTVTPSKSGYLFSPANKTYTNVVADQIGQNYTAAIAINVDIAGTNQVSVGAPPQGSLLQMPVAGINNGPVKIASIVPILGSQRMIYTINGVATSFSEMMGLPNNQLDSTYWLPWYNNVDLDTQLRFANVSGATGAVRVFIGGVEMTGSPFTLAPARGIRVSFAGINSGPVKIVSNVNIVAAERVIYKVNNVNTSYSEMMALPNSQLNSTYWFPWYNNVDLDSQLRFSNVSGTTGTVRIFIGGVEMSGSPFALAPGASKRLSFSGIYNGPVKIVSTVNIVAAERVIYKVNNVNTSYSEMMGLPNNQLDSTYWFPRYNNVDLDSQLRFANVSASTATVHVFIRAQEMTGSPFILVPGASKRLSFAGINNGLVKIVSNVNIVAAERVIYPVNGVNTSYSEMMGLPNSQLNSIYWLPWYNNVDLDTHLRLGLP